MSKGIVSKSHDGASRRVFYWRILNTETLDFSVEFFIDES